MGENPHPPLIELRIADCGIEGSRDSFPDPQSAILIRTFARPALAAAGIASMTKGSRPSAAHNSSSTAGSRVNRQTAVLLRVARVMERAQSRLRQAERFGLPSQNHTSGSRMRRSEASASRPFLPFSSSIAFQFVIDIPHLKTATNNPHRA